MWRSKLLPWLTIYFLVLVVYVVFSYALTAPNLILTNWEPYWQFQTWMWQTFFNDRRLLADSYLVIITMIVTYYLVLLKKSRHLKSLASFFTFKSLLIYIIFLSPLLLANNALSYDVFNYIFNAKMVVYYEANPHQKVALDYAYDDWTRFMHNTHTPAPYGYGWTALSILPYTLSLGKFLPAWFLFRGMSLVSLIGLWLLLKKYLTDEQKKSWLAPLVFFNPLLLIEVITNSHNDLWMMVPAMWSLLILVDHAKSKTLLRTAFSLLLLAVTIWIKLATAVLLPLWLVLALYRLKIFTSFWPVMASALMFVPLLTTRSQQFLPWYLVWCLVWLPFWPQLTQSSSKLVSLLNKLSAAWLMTLIAFSISGLGRYWPYLRIGEYTAQVFTQQMWILWAVPTLIFLVTVVKSCKK